ncbi:hypothetical protein ACJRO7_014937 [Eucalyptus globulus]|uniref:Uncharacterized protein n=1 Tax=Eucalyptus globulus TaxID=34317 RepID=A0ABD3L2V7_EUCGL
MRALKGFTAGLLSLGKFDWTGLERLKKCRWAKVLQDYGRTAARSSMLDEGAANEGDAGRWETKQRKRKRSSFVDGVSDVWRRTPGSLESSLLDG